MPTRPIVRRLRAEPLLALGSVLAFLAVLAGVELALRGFDRRYLDRARGPDVYSSRLGWRLRGRFVRSVPPPALGSSAAPLDRRARLPVRSYTRSATT